MPQPPIDSYGLIGNMRAAALVGPTGSVDWLCLPHFDSPSVFAALLDENRGGRFEVSVVGDDVGRRSFYIPDTNVLVTRSIQKGNVAELQDFMPVTTAHHDRPRPVLTRIFQVEHGSFKLRMECFPAFDYGRASHAVSLTQSQARFDGGGFHLVLDSSIPLRVQGSGVVAESIIRAGERAVFALHFQREHPSRRHPVDEPEAAALLSDTRHYWRDWIGQCTYAGRWREHVRRSALTLKLLTFEPTGAVIAAPTASLPERIGGRRNWDYRYVWLRDAAFTAYALLRIGFTREARKFMEFLQQRCHELEPGRMLRPVYGIDGRHELPESELAHLSGYRQSRPVRVGNAAYQQLQLDIAGSLMDAVYLFNKHGAPITHDLWMELTEILDWVCDNWQRQDAGIWEIRTAARDFVHSKLMCWVALDRGLRLAASRGLPVGGARWRDSRDQIYHEIIARGFNPERGAFTQSYGSTNLDAANLLMPLVYFISPLDPRMAGTLNAVDRPPEEGGLVSDVLVYRYLPEETHDGMDEPEGAFSLCTFWLAEALARSGRMNPSNLNRARLIFERMLEFAGPLGLYSEQVSPDGVALGNYPQALTHLSLITAALHLDQALG